MALLAHYKLDDNAANTTVTATVGGNAALLGGENTSAKYVGDGNGPGGNFANAGFLLNGTDDYINAGTIQNGSGVNFQALTNSTFSCWFKRQIKTSGYYTLAGIYEGFASGDSNWLLAFADAIYPGAFRWRVRKWGASATEFEAYTNTNSSWSDDTWTHIAVTLPSRKIFVNGEDVTSTFGFSGVGASTPDDETIDWLIGASDDGNGVPGSFFSGAIADVRFYDSDEQTNIGSIMAGAAPLFLVDPKIVGDIVPGTTLSVSWTANESVTAEYWWYTADDVLGTNETLVGTNANYTLQSADSGKYLRCDMRLTATGGAQLQSLVRTGEYVGAVGAPWIVSAVVSSIDNGGTSASYSWNIPPHQAGDILLVVTRRYNADPILPSGWTQLQSTVYAGTHRFRVFYKVGDGVQTSQFDQTGTWQSKSHIVMAIRGAADFPGAWSGEYVDPEVLENYGISYPQITVANDNSLLLHTAFCRNSKGPSVPSTSRRWASFTGQATNIVYHKYAPAAAGTSPAFYTGGLDTWRYWRTGTFAIAPAPSSGTDHLTANSLASGTPTLGSPALAQNHSISVPDLNGGTIFFESPTVSQKHAFTASGLTSGTPVLDSPALGQAGDLTANPLSAGTPTLASPTLNQTHVLTASALSAGSPTLASPALNQVHVLTAPTAISSGAPTLASPSLNQTHVLTANPLSSGVPELASPVLGQPGQIAANPLSTGSPTLGTPSLSQVHVSTANALSAGAPTLASPALSQVHVLGTDGASAGSPTLGSPALSVVHNLVPSALSSGTPVLDSPILGIDGLMTALPLDAGTPTLDSPALSQVHVLSLVALSTGLPTLPTPLLNWDQIPYTPSYLRTFYPPVSLPERTVPQVSFGNRTFALPYYSGRTFPQVPYDHRTGIPTGS